MPPAAAPGGAVLAALGVDPRERFWRHLAWNARASVVLTFAVGDLRGFTAFAETAEPEDVMGVLREFHAETGRLVLAWGGMLERFACARKPWPGRS